MSPRHLILIAGMHRSGTSALCSALEQCGVSFGANLLDPMAGVNEDGFWEDADAVQLNEQVLAQLGGTWYAPPPGLAQFDWSGDALSGLREAAEAVLARGEGSLQALKDPRLCLTLPLWLAASEKLGISVTVCIVSRAPLEVARSLEKRDGFPLGYGLRLYARYREQLATNAPPDSPYVTFDTLLADPAATLATLAEVLPLTLPAEGLEGTVRPELRHHQSLQGDSLLQQADGRNIEQAALEAAIEREYPKERVAGELVRCLVERAEELTRLGLAHSSALETLDQRDADVDSLSALHTEALAIIDERDAQIVEFDRRLAQTGEELSQALSKLREIQRILSLPVLGHLLRLAKWLYEKR